MEEGLKGLEEEANGVGKRLGEAQVLQHMLGMPKMKKYEGRSKTILQGREGCLLCLLWGAAMVLEHRGSLANTRASVLLNMEGNGEEGDELEA